MVGDVFSVGVIDYFVEFIRWFVDEGFDFFRRVVGDSAVKIVFVVSFGIDS